MRAMPPKFGTRLLQSVPHHTPPLARLKRAVQITAKAFMPLPQPSPGQSRSTWSPARMPEMGTSTSVPSQGVHPSHSFSFTDDEKTQLMNAFSGMMLCRSLDYHEFQDAVKKICDESVSPRIKEALTAFKDSSHTQTPFFYIANCPMNAQDVNEESGNVTEAFFEMLAIYLDDPTLRHVMIDGDVCLIHKDATIHFHL